MVPSLSTEPSCSTVTFTSSARTKRHVVLHHHHAAGAVDVAQQLGGLLGFGVGHAGHGFIDQEQTRVLGQQHADFEPLLLPVAQVPGPAVAVVAQAYGAQDALDPVFAPPRSAVRPG